MNMEAARKNLLEIKEIFDALNIKFWLRGGTLLGAVREKNFIPFDLDIDLNIFVKDWYPSLSTEFESKGFQSGIKKLHPPLVQRIWLKKRGIKTDIMIGYAYPPEDAYIFLTLHAPDSPVTIAPARFYKGDHFIKFLGQDFRVPNPPEQYLEKAYGKTWKTQDRAWKWSKVQPRIHLDKYLKWLKRGNPMDIEAAKKNLLDIKEVFDSLKMKFWLCGGCLLGAVRDRSFIPWDVDIDLRVLAKDWNPSVCPEFEKKGFQCAERRHYDIQGERRIYAVRLIREDPRTSVGLNYYYPPDDVYIFLVPPHLVQVRSRVVPAKLYRGDYFIEFLGTKFRVPNPPEDFLVRRYGERWGTPIKGDWRPEDFKDKSIDKYITWFCDHPEREWLK